MNIYEKIIENAKGRIEAFDQVNRLLNVCSINNEFFNEAIQTHIYFNKNRIAEYSDKKD